MFIIQCMLTEDELIDIDGWERDHYGDFICEWLYELEEDTVSHDWTAFALVVQEQEEGLYQISISVAFPGGGGDLLSADYSDSCRTVEEAMAIAEEFTEQVEAEYIN